MNDLLKVTPSVINIGLESFVPPMAEAGATAVHADWTPPAEGDAAAGRNLAVLTGRPEVDAANEKALAALLDSSPRLVGVSTARETVPGMDGLLILHSGPPIAWEDMCGPVQGAVVGAILLEGWADDAEAAFALAASQAVRFDSCHHHCAVGPMAGVISPSMPVWVVEDRTSGHRTFSNMNEGLGKVLRFGANSVEVLDRLRWMRDVLGPCLAQALEDVGPLDIKPLMAQALHMGDEVHNRNNAASALLFRYLTPGILRSDLGREDKETVFRFISGNDHFFLNISMAACKAMADAAHGFENSTLVTAMARNGVEFGIRVSGLGDRWFTTESPVVDGLYFAGFGPEDSAADLGDSTITETVGLGGFSMAAAPAIVKFVNGTPRQALAYSRQMQLITEGVNNAFTLPMLNFSGVAAGIDVRKVLDTNILPVLNTGIAHKDAGVGQIGAGIARAPMACFIQAAEALAEMLAGGERCLGS
ncbi:MAG: DUF1116 domain-containing protein [Pseudodesulfovibrio sp.]|uniref:DUF1116 domain-containing protein n=1 Tax=Pseudodesulfovibrio sp. TaxID=2035812 RepID=UPI003D127F54